MSAKTYPEDYGLSAEQLDHKYNQDGDGEHPGEGYTCWDWVQVVAQRMTKSGYWAWVAEQLEYEQERSWRTA